METVLELDDGSLIDVEFICTKIDPPDRAHGINYSYFHFEIIGDEVQITDTVYDQLVSAYEDELFLESDLNRYERNYI